MRPIPDQKSHVLCVLFSGFDREEQIQDTVYLAVNTHWEPVTLFLPDLPFEWNWYIAVNTGDLSQTIFQDEEMPLTDHTVLLGERSVILFVVKKRSV